ncbi:MAG: TGS domain-containing protein [Gammaproteobacteria bacterium]|nr:TGS domain-containing protein [Gammaproteobacteria bacterium]NIR82865.1 TGS domain-containing protein [Gammaproteobacteria bacterium]NIR89974.1 TGS domain-containing protein [Gammaproteobacteria bacterium]NIU04023.1 TGS domain-containing protein [Gammaproteobacteria bacterium]NIV51343.1 TGS domain-containing protein [Gammaproteobacteria bacterium]
MPANLSPEYKAAEAAFKKARDPKERLECLREMLRTMPKHKGTERLQADIKTRIKHLTEELSAPRKGGARSRPAESVAPEGAAQIALIGAPNAGKSSLHIALTGSQAEVGSFPFTTWTPLPGMLAYEDIHLQIVDLPPIAAEHPVPWIANALRPADACLLVVDLPDPECIERFRALRELLAQKGVTLLERGQSVEAAPEDSSAEGLHDPFAIRLPTLLVATKADLMSRGDEELAALRELLGVDYPSLLVSARTGFGLEAIGRWVFETLGIVRVYTKAPGQPLDRGHPFTVRRGQTVQDVAVHVHRELATSLKFAWLWTSDDEKPRQVSRDHVVADRDVLELHG